MESANIVLGRPLGLFPVMNVWFETINPSYREGGWQAEESESA